MAEPTSRQRCTTRALKNAQYLKQMAPETFGNAPYAQGFGTGVPIEILRRLHRLRHDSPELKEHPGVSQFLRHHRMPVPQRMVR
jgi:hypothetical protein